MKKVKRITLVLLMAGVILLLNSCADKNPVISPDGGISESINQISLDKELKIFNLSEGDIDYEYISSGCMFKDKFYIFAQEESNVNDYDYLPVNAEIYLSNGKSELFQSKYKIIDICCSDDYIYSLETDLENTYILKYRNDTMEYKAEIEIEVKSTNVSINYDYKNKTIILENGSKYVVFSEEMEVVSESSFLLKTSDCCSYNLNYDKADKQLSLEKIDSEMNKIYVSHDFNDISGENIIDYGYFMKDNNPVVFSVVDSVSGPVTMVNVVNSDDGMTFERYDITDSEYIWNGFGEYKFIFLREGKIYGFVDEKTSPVVIFEKSDDFQKYNDKVELLSDCAVLVQYKYDESIVSEDYYLVCYDLEGNIISKTEYPRPIDKYFSNIIGISSDGTIMYLISYELIEKSCVTHLYVSENGNEFSEAVTLEQRADKILIDSSGNIYISFVDNENGKYNVIVFDSNGNIKSEIETDYFDIYGFYERENKVYLAFQNENSMISQAVVDVNSGQLLNIKEVMNSGIKLLTDNSTSQNEVYYYDSYRNIIGKYDFQSGELRDIISLNGYNVSDINDIIFQNGDILFVISESKIYKYQNACENVSVIEVYAIDSPAELSLAVEKYNNEHTDSRVVIHNHNSDNENINEDFYKLIITGNEPDILLANSTFDISRYENKNLFLDLSECIKHSSVIDDDKLWSKIYKRFNDEKIEQIIPFFSPKTIISRSSLDYDDSLESFFNFVENNNIKFEGYGESMYDMLIALYNENSTNKQHGISRFDTIQFENLLKTIKHINDYEDEYSDSILVEFGNANNYDLFQNKFTESNYCKLPTKNDMYFYVSDYIGVSILEKTQHIDQIWNFIEILFSEDIQKDVTCAGEYAPVRKGVAESIIPEYYSDSINDDIILLYNEGMERGIISLNLPHTVKQIINDEIQLYLSSDEIDAHETAQNIQNKIDVFVEEFY